MSLSLKGIARRYRRITTGFSVIKDIFGDQNITRPVSLRSKLRSIAHEEHMFPQSECVFFWIAAFEQIWSHIVIRIQLNPDADVTAGTINILRTVWQNGIQNIWSNRWGCGRPGEITCPFTFQVVWVNTGQHHSVRVNTGMKCQDSAGHHIVCRTNMGRWHTGDSGNVVAHEFGHMLGLVDEYVENPPCPDRDPVNTGTIMDNNSNNIPLRMMKRFADNIGSNVVNI